MNKVYMTGMIATIPVFRMEKEEIPHLTFQLCIRHKTQSGEMKSELYRVSAWHKTAEWARKHLEKGQIVNVMGYLAQRKIQIGEETRFAVEISAEEFCFMKSERQAANPAEDASMKTSVGEKQ